MSAAARDFKVALGADDARISFSVPAQELARVYCERLGLVAAAQPAESTIAPAGATLGLGADYPGIEGGVYAGRTMHAGELHDLVLLAPERESATWEEAKAWAAEQGGELPSRVDLIVLWDNLRDRFQKEWYWSNEKHAHYADYAWVQSFASGDQSYGHTSGQYRARAVRRVPIR